MGYSDDVQIYNIIRQLMELADSGSIQGFTELLDESFPELFESSRFRETYADTVIITGLIARNARQLLEITVKKLEDENIGINSLNEPILLAGILIHKKKCREAVEFFIEKFAGDFDSSAVEYIACMALYTDDLPLFGILYNTWGDNAVELPGFIPELNTYTTLREMAFLGGVIFDSRNILDHITDCGRLLKGDKLPFDVSFDTVSDIGFIRWQFYYQYNKKCSPEICWLKKLREMYFKNDAPDEAFKYLISAARQMKIIKSDANQYYMDFTGDILIDTDDLCIPEIARICGAKVQDFSMIVYWKETASLNRKYMSELLRQTAGDEPYVEFKNKIGRRSENVMLFADIFQGRLTVRLIDYFFRESLADMRRKVKFAFDISDPRTEKYLLKRFNNTLYLNKKLLFNTLEFLIDEKLAAPEQLARLVDGKNRPDIIKFIYDRSKKKEETV